MEFKMYSTMGSVKKFWEQVEQRSNNVYQSYTYNLLLYKYRKTSISNIKSFNTKTVFVVAFDKGQAVAIAPLTVNENPRCVRLLGYGSNSGSLDFIYNNEKYARYSPGIVLINEYLKLEITSIFDLGRGQETYKIKLNGVMYKTYNLICEVP